MKENIYQHVINTIGLERQCCHDVSTRVDKAHSVHTKWQDSIT